MDQQEKIEKKIVGFDVKQYLIINIILSVISFICVVGIIVTAIVKGGEGLNSDNVVDWVPMFVFITLYGVNYFTMLVFSIYIFVRFPDTIRKVKHLEANCILNVIPAANAVSWIISSIIEHKKHYNII